MAIKHKETRAIIPVVLAGGSGLRLWPLSRKNYTKALLKLRDDNSLLQNVLSEIALVPFLSDPIIVGNVEHRTVMTDQLKAINVKATILLEAKSFNTAAATAIAAQYALTKTDNPLFLILPVDQAIDSISQFAKMVKASAKWAIKGNLVIFGVKPDSASIDYGYIKKGQKLPQSSGYLVKQFKEKPNVKKATFYLRSREYSWNSGIFLFLASTFLEELASYSPRVFLASKKSINKITINNDTILINKSSMKGCPNISIDQAVLEKTKRAVVFPFRGGWHDLGNWNSLYDMASKDKKGNVVTKNVESFNTKKCYLYSTKQLLVTSGINNILVVVTQDAVLVASRDNIANIKNIVKHLVRKK